MDKQTFLEKYNLTESDLSEADVSFEYLEEIAKEYRKNEQELRDCAKSFIDEYLYDIERAGIHSYRYRIKELDHLLEKVVRKRRENPEKFRKLDFSNYHIFSVLNYMTAFS